MLVYQEQRFAWYRSERCTAALWPSLRDTWQAIGIQGSDDVLTYPCPMPRKTLEECFALLQSLAAASPGKVVVLLVDPRCPVAPMFLALHQFRITVHNRQLPGWLPPRLLVSASYHRNQLDPLAALLNLHAPVRNTSVDTLTTVTRLLQF